jgi:hypothetical protein
MQFLSAIIYISQVNMFSSNKPMFLSSFNLLFEVKWEAVTVVEGLP